MAVAQTSGTVAFSLSGPGSPVSYNLLMEGPIGTSGAYKEVGVLAQTSWGVSTGPDNTLTTTGVGIHVKALIQNGTTGGSLALQTTLGGTSIQMLANSVCTLVQAN